MTTKKKKKKHAGPAEDFDWVLVIKTETSKMRGEKEALFLTGRLFGAKCQYKVVQ